MRTLDVPLTELDDTPGHVVMYSGGICSWAAAKRVVKQQGPEETILLFADTLIEDEDLYRFLEESAKALGTRLIRIAEGRTPWEVMHKKRLIGNSRLDPCSKILKRELLKKWQAVHCDPDKTTLYVGLDWSEQHRIDRLNAMGAWKYTAPMAEPPYLTKGQMLEWARTEGLTPPRLYNLGFAHNNCGGFCIKAGQAQFERLLRTMPERYAYHEEQEEKLRAIVGDHAILKETVEGIDRPLTLRRFRERLERQADLFDKHAWGGCGCAL